ncbi:hypothetical protein HPB47_019103 [Ixodes persulcatus]|uniref:Uncharacterized protein n=1 Tax=Ixodes persulcatus TaxID=34615 RepID=A0AC60QLM5_IXOPE|nr:hypothetical protein HPB47_019103 [Ixodes persulcatus]
MEVSSEESHSREAWVPSIGRQDPKGREVVERVVNVKKAGSSEAELAEPPIELLDLLVEAEYIVQSVSPKVMCSMHMEERWNLGKLRMLVVDPPNGTLQRRQREWNSACQVDKTVP